MTRPLTCPHVPLDSKKIEGFYRQAVAKRHYQFGTLQESNGLKKA